MFNQKSANSQQPIKILAVIFFVPNIFKYYYGSDDGVNYVFGECTKHIGVFLKWSRTFIEFRELRESDKSLKHELDSI